MIDLTKVFEIWSYYSSKPIIVEYVERFNFNIFPPSGWEHKFFYIGIIVISEIWD